MVEKSGSLTDVQRTHLFDQVIQFLITLLSHIVVITIVEQVVVLSIRGLWAFCVIALTAPEAATLLMNYLHR